MVGGWMVGWVVGSWRLTLVVGKFDFLVSNFAFSLRKFWQVIRSIARTMFNEFHANAADHANTEDIAQGLKH